jgi:uncharacterized membrane protein YeiB
MVGTAIESPTRVRLLGRIVGIDVARGLAMLGMVIAHYVWAGADTGPAAAVARAMGGRAMPLFMLLGGVGVTLLTRRSAHPDRGLVIRAAILFVIGLFLDETTDRIAIVLQFYGLLFLVAPVLRRLTSWALLALAALVTAVGAWTGQVAYWPPHPTNLDAVLDGLPAIRSLAIDGYYPFFPVFAFFAIGVVLGRLDLRDRRLAAALAGVGAGVGLASLLAANALTARIGIERVTDRTAETFDWARLVDVSGHSAMPAWVVNAAGTSVAVLGLSLLIAPRVPDLVQPIAALGSVALSFYVFQVLTTLVIPSPDETGLAREWLTVAVLYVGFTLAALVWKRWFRSGPLEALLRVGSATRARR